MSQDIFTLENPLFKSYLFYSAVLILKVLFVPILIARYRFTKQVWITPEDCITPKSKVKHDDPDVERVRRAHLNDLENIPIFFIAALAYLATGPSAWLYLLLLRFFTICRIIHTFVYAIIVIPQPARALAFFGGYFTTAFMVLMTIKNFW